MHRGQKTISAVVPQVPTMENIQSNRKLKWSFRETHRQGFPMFASRSSMLYVAETLCFQHTILYAFLAQDREHNHMHKGGSGMKQLHQWQPCPWWSLSNQLLHFIYLGVLHYAPYGNLKYVHVIVDTFSSFVHALALSGIPYNPQVLAIVEGTTRTLKELLAKTLLPGWKRSWP